VVVVSWMVWWSDLRASSPCCFRSNWGISLVDALVAQPAKRLLQSWGGGVPLEWRWWCYSGVGVLLKSFEWCWSGVTVWAFVSTYRESMERCGYARHHLLLLI